MSILRISLVPSAALVLALAAGHAHAASATMSVGLVLRAPGEMGAPQHEGVVNAAGQMRVDGAQPDALERAIARAPRTEHRDARPDGSRVHSIQF